MSHPTFWESEYKRQFYWPAPTSETLVTQVDDEDDEEAFGAIEEILLGEDAAKSGRYRQDVATETEPRELSHVTISDTSEDELTDAARTNLVSSLGMTSESESSASPYEVATSATQTEITPVPVVQPRESEKKKKSRSKGKGKVKNADHNDNRAHSIISFGHGNTHPVARDAYMKTFNVKNAAPDQVVSGTLLRANRAKALFKKSKPTREPRIVEKEERTRAPLKKKQKEIEWDEHSLREYLEAREKIRANDTPYTTEYRKEFVNWKKPTRVPGPDAKTHVIVPVETAAAIVPAGVPSEYSLPPPPPYHEALSPGFTSRRHYPVQRRKDHIQIMLEENEHRYLENALHSLQLGDTSGGSTVRSHLVEELMRRKKSR